MNRLHLITFRLLLFAVALSSCFVARTLAQKPTPSPSSQAATKPDDKAGKKEEQENPFAPEPAGPLPAGMTGADTNDPRAHLTPGFFNAGETSLGLKHLLLVKKPAAFQLGSDNPDDPKVQKILGQIGNPAQLAQAPKGVQLVIAQLAFANSDIAFQGNHLFQGNFYGLSIYDISNPAKTSLLTTMICPGGQNDVSVYKNLLFMSVEMANGRLDCGTQGFPPAPAPAKEPEKDEKPAPPPAQKDRFRGVRIFDITDIKNPKLLTRIFGVAGMDVAHTFTPDPTGRYAVTEFEYTYAPLRVFDLKPGLDGTVKNINRPIGAWTANWQGLPHNHEVRWPYVFVSTYGDEFQVFNFMDPSNPYTVGYFDTSPGAEHVGRNPNCQGCVESTFGIDVRNADGLIVTSGSGFWAFKMDGFDGWNGHQWGMPNISSAQDWDNGPDGAPKPSKVS